LPLNVVIGLVGVDWSPICGGFVAAVHNLSLPLVRRFAAVFLMKTAFIFSSPTVLTWLGF
jgi:hypothetical protein